jgi:hypothetical protein
MDLLEKCITVVQTLPEESTFPLGSSGEGNFPNHFYFHYTFLAYMHLFHWMFDILYSK